VTLDGKVFQTRSAAIDEERAVTNHRTTDGPTRAEIDVVGKNELLTTPAITFGTLQYQTSSRVASTHGSGRFH